MGDPMQTGDLINALILGIVEGLTEFLPVSSTGHLIAAGTFINFNPSYAKAFDVIIQFGAIAAVCWEFRSKIVSVVVGLPKRALARKFACNIVVATIPAVTLALFFEKAIKAKLFSPLPVAIALIVGGVVILMVERHVHDSPSTQPIVSMDAISYTTAFKVGLFQCLALIPGTSRSGATIIGGMLVGLDRRVATEFSFFLAIPIIFGATLYEMSKSFHGLTFESFEVLALGLITAFISAFICIRWLLRYVASHDFTAFGWYRIVVGFLILTWFLAR